MPKDTITALEKAHDLLFIVRDQLANVIASGDYEQSDVTNHEMADYFIKWYRERKLRGKGNWRVKLEKAMNKLLELTKGE